MRGFLMLCLMLPLTGCFATTGNGRTVSETVEDDGMNPVRRTTVTRNYEGTSLGGSLPVMMGGYGGYGQVGVAGPSCALHPDRCAVIQTATVVQPTYVTSVGGGGHGGTAMVGGTPGVPLDPAQDTSELEARIERLEAAVPKLAGAGILSLRQSCYAILKDPAVIKDDAERATIVAGCEKVLKSNPKADAKSEEK